MSLKDIAAPVIRGVSSLVGAGLGARGQDKATEANLTASREALAYQREKDAAMEKQWEVWNANRMALLQRYGVDIAQFSGGGPAAAEPDVARPRPQAGAGPAYAVEGPPVAGPGPRGIQAMNLGEIMARKPGGGGGPWDSWDAHGLRGGR